MVLDHHEQDGECGTTIILGETADISHLAEFSFYDWIWFVSPKESKYDRMMLGRWLGPSFDVGDALTFAIFTGTAEIVHRSSVLPLSVEERRSDDVKQMKRSFMDQVSRKLGERAKGIENGNDVEFTKNNFEESVPYYEPYEDDDEEASEVPKVSEEDNPVEFDKYVSAKVQLHRDEMTQRGFVRGRKRDAVGNLIGHYHENPILDTALYEVEFEDGHVEAFHANQIAEAIYASVDEDGFSYQELHEIVDHNADGSAVRADDGYTMLRGRRVPKRTTKGWKLCVRWKDESTSWVDLKDLKDSHPVLLAEYAVANKLVSEPAFQWWVPYTLKKKDRIIKAMKKRYYRKMEKFGLELPKSVKRALEIDRETGTKFWEQAIRKEVATVLPAVDIKEKGDSPPVGSTLIDLTIVFDIKINMSLYTQTMYLRCQRTRILVYRK